MENGSNITPSNKIIEGETIYASYGEAGGDSYFINPSTVLAQGGPAGKVIANIFSQSTSSASNFIGDGGGRGGIGNPGNGSNTFGAGGPGGAGGYSGSGGSGATYFQLDSSKCR